MSSAARRSPAIPTAPGRWTRSTRWRRRAGGASTSATSAGSRTTTTTRPTVLHVARPAAGGLRRHLATLVPELVARGRPCAIAAPPELLALFDRLPPDGPETIRLRPLAIADRPGLPADLTAIRRLREIAREVPVGLVHAHGLRAAWIAASARLPAPLVATVHNLAARPTNPLAAALLRFSLARADRLIAVSEAVRQTLAAAGAPAGRIAVVPNGLAFPRPRPRETPGALRERLGVPADAPVVACVARLMADKGVDLLVRAWPAVRADVPAARCLVAGDGPDRPALETLCGGAPGLTLLGQVDEVASLYAAADLVAIPSRREGQSLVCLEALAADPPACVVACAVGGLPEMIEDGVTGRLVPPESPPALAEAILALLRDPAARRRLAEAGKATVERRYTAEAMAEATLAVYDAVGSGA